MTAFWKAGIRCFDVDVTTLQDGTLLASHPSRIIQAIGGEKQPQGSSLQSIRQQGATSTTFPLLSDVLLKFAHLVGHELIQPLQPPTPRQAPMLLLDLKGPLLTRTLLQQVVDQAHKLHIENHVVLLVSDWSTSNDTSPGIDVLALSQSLARSLPLGLVLRDRLEQDWDVPHIQRVAQRYAPTLQVLAPSLKFSFSWFRQVHETVGLPMVVWTMDQQEDFLASINKEGVIAVIANQPIHV